MEHNKVDQLVDIVVERYHKERPEVVLTKSDLDSIWYSVAGELHRNGEAAAAEYAHTAKLSL